MRGGFFGRGDLPRLLVTRGLSGSGVSAWRATMAGLCACLVGIGLGRFAYTPLIPPLIDAHWFAPSDALYLGAANLAGYLAGALVARQLAARLPVTTLLRAAMVFATLAFFACAAPLSLAWYFCWRLVAGLSGGVIMVLAASAVLPHTPIGKRGLVSGTIFTGVGLGIAASGTLVPLLLKGGLTETWCGLGVLSGLLTLISWHSWPPAGPKRAPHLVSREGRAVSPVLIRGLAVEYGLNAVALVPPMIFLVDFIARGLHQGLDSGAHYWVLYGLGAMVGPLLTGHLADRAGFGPALRLAYFVQGAAIAVPAFTSGTIPLIVSCVAMGALTPGIVPLVFGRVHELFPHDLARQQHAWSTVTTSYAICQAAAAYGFSFLFSRTGGDYRLLFAAGASAVGLGLVLDLVLTVATRRPAKGISQ
jgi:predicted MFS family arabinose efflux permease